MLVRVLRLRLPYSPIQYPNVQVSKHLLSVGTASISADHLINKSTLWTLSTQSLRSSS